MDHEQATGADGTLSLPAAPRTYTVTVCEPGYEPQVLDGVQVLADQKTVLEIECVLSNRR